MKSLDPRVMRLPEIGQPGPISPKEHLDQFGTYEVFVQPKDGKAFQHEGIVHAPNLEMAYILAKETFTRRFTCISLYVVETRLVTVSSTSEGDINAYDLIDANDLPSQQSATRVKFEIYHLHKRGKQHIHAGTVEASSPSQAMATAKNKLNAGKTIYNIWAIRTLDIRFTAEEDRHLWTTLPDKKFRDAAEYKGGDKLKTFLLSRDRAT